MCAREEASMKAFRMAVVVGAVLGAFGASAAFAQDVGASGGTSGGGGLRIAGQVRLDALNIAGINDRIDTGGGEQVVSFVPIVVGGVRIDALFLGIGLGYYSFSIENCDDDSCDSGDSVAASGWSIAPTITLDLVADRWGGLYLLGMANLGTIGTVTEERFDPGMTMTEETDGIFRWGLNIGGGVRGNITGVGLGLPDVVVRQRLGGLGLRAWALRCADVRSVGRPLISLV
jgi:hypothetical protein